MKNSILDLYMHITMPDDSIWKVPVSIIANNRAAYYAPEYDNNFAKSLAEDTIPLFNDNHYEIIDWASNNMNWEDVEKYSSQVSKPEQIDFQEGWVNGEKEIV